MAVQVTYNPQGKKAKTVTVPMDGTPEERAQFWKEIEMEKHGDKDSFASAFILGLVAGIFFSIICCGIVYGVIGQRREKEWRDAVMKHGAGEYFLDDDNTAKWRWK